jgi:biotin carboxylase
MKHIVFVDSTVSGLLAFHAAKRIGCYVTFIKQRDASCLTISVKDDDSKIRPHLAHVDQYLEIESLNDDGFGMLLDKIHAERPIDALLSTSEAAIVPIAREAERLSLLYPAYDALCGAVYKNRLRDTLREHGLRSPDHQVLSEVDLVGGVVPRIALPFVVKPTRGFAKQFSAMCFTADDFHAFVNRLRESRSSSDPMIDALVSHEYMIEEYVRGTLHSAEVIVQDGKVQCYATTIRFRAHYSEMLEMTATMPSGLGVEARQEIKDYVQEVFTALKLDVGLYHVELLRDECGPCLVEINARMMGSVAPQMYRMMTGVDPFELLIRLHLDEPIRIDDSLLKSAGTVVTVAARHGGRISDSYDPKALEELLRRYEIDFCTVNVRPGEDVGVYTGNIGTIGHVIVLGEDPFAAARKGHRFLTDLDPIFGLELAKYFDPATF